MTVDDPGAPPADNGEFWLFGYGQDHRGTPEAPGRVVTLIERSFWATLRDPHPAPRDGKVWGVAYRIEPARVAEVKEYLDIREINGYSIHYTPFYPAGAAAPAATATTTAATTTTSSADPASSPLRTLVYIGTPENDQFTGPQDVQALAEHIYRSEGPSGLNRAYLLSLDDALRELCPESGDEHVTDLSERVRAIAAREHEVVDEEERRRAVVTREGEASAVVVDRAEDEAAAMRHEFKQVSSVEEQEETEKAL